jgi:hypothetical protein
MLNQLAAYSFLCLTIASLCGCPSKAILVSQLEAHYADRFSSLNMLKISEIKQKGINRSLKGSSIDKVWESMIIVIMQIAPIVKESKEDGFLIAPPYVLYLENQESIVLYVYFIDEMYKRADMPSEDAVKVEIDGKKRYLETTMGQIVTQLQADEKLQPGKPWSYLAE